MNAPFDISIIDGSLDSRATTFENPTGARGAGGTAAGGRKGAPSATVAAGERVMLADIDGPGVVRHIWMTVPPAPPEQLRALVLEVRYDGSADPSIAVPVCDFFGLPHGRLAPFDSAVMSAQEGRGLNCYLPLPFRRSIRLDFVNAGSKATTLFYQVDYTLQRDLPVGAGYLHATFRRQNPTVRGQDFVIADGLRGPGRFAGCNVGVRVLDGGNWYGEGEVKVYRDGDTTHPTICGTGLEDYVGTAWGLGRHAATFGGAPLVLVPPTEPGAPAVHAVPDFVGFYRWHLRDPIMFARDLRVEVQQIGYVVFRSGDEAAAARYRVSNPPAGTGWITDPSIDVAAMGLAERVDDYCATAYVYCEEPQPVAEVDTRLATEDIARRPYEAASIQEIVAGIARDAEDRRER